MRSGQKVEGSVAVQSGMRYANEKAADILEGQRFSGLRKRMVDLFLVERNTSKQIADQVLDEMELDENISINTASSIVRRVLQALIDDETRSNVHRELHANALERRRNEVDAARDKWMRGAGLKVWTNEEDEYFTVLVQTTKRGRFTDHARVAEAMCAKFGPGTFDANSCRRHLERLRRSGKMPQSDLPRNRSAQNTPRLVLVDADATGDDEEAA